VLASGSLPPDPGEFVATRKLANILAELGNRYDMVVIDSPPLLRVGDAMTLSSRADGLILLTRLNAIKRPMLRDLSRVLESVPTTKLGYVVTGLQREEGYGYGYGYGYGKGYDANNRGQTGRPESVSSNGRAVTRDEETV
jgi:Mrp family chromosome partitioning ATPase